MKATEINLKKDGFNFHCQTFTSGSHYKFLMSIGRVFPSTTAQARYFVKCGAYLDILNREDVELVEGMLNKYGFSGDYKYTKSKSSVRLLNHNDLVSAIRKNYSI